MTPVCNLNALTTAERERSAALRRALRGATVERAELPEGYAYRLTGAASLAEIAEWIALERRCCPFFRFELEVDGDAGPVWLRLTGAGVKDFLAQSGRDASSQSVTAIAVSTPK
jgi:hypothetical protein